jgi:hypothetical protein
MMSKRSRVLLSSSALLLTSYGCAILVHFLYLLNRMKVHGDSIESLMGSSFFMGRALTPVILLGFILLTGFVVSIISDARRKTTP